MVELMTLDDFAEDETEQEQARARAYALASEMGDVCPRCSGIGMTQGDAIYGYDCDVCLGAGYTEPAQAPEMVDSTCYGIGGNNCHCDFCMKSGRYTPREAQSFNLLTDEQKAEVGTQTSVSGQSMPQVGTQIAESEQSNTFDFSDDIKSAGNYTPEQAAEAQRLHGQTRLFKSPRIVRIGKKGGHPWIN